MQRPAAGLDRGRILEQRRVVTLHRAQMNEQGLGERVAVGESGEAGEALEGVAIRRQGVGLLVRHHLQPVLEQAQELVGCVQLGASMRVDPAALGERSQRAERLRQAQFRQLAKARGWKTGLVGPWDDGDHKRAQFYE